MFMLTEPWSHRVSIDLLALTEGLATHSMKWTVNVGGTGLGWQGRATSIKKVLRSFQLQILQLRDEHTHMAIGPMQPSHTSLFDPLHNLTIVTAFPAISQMNDCNKSHLRSPLGSNVLFDLR